MMHPDARDGVSSLTEQEQLALLAETWPDNVRHLETIQILWLLQPKMARTILGMAEQLRGALSAGALPDVGSLRDQLIARLPKKPRPARAALTIVRRAANGRR